MDTLQLAGQLKATLRRMFSSQQFAEFNPHFTAAEREALASADFARVPNTVHTKPMLVPIPYHGPGFGGPGVTAPRLSRARMQSTRSLHCLCILLAMAERVELTVGRVCAVT